MTHNNSFPLTKFQVNLEGDGSAEPSVLELRNVLRALFVEWKQTKKKEKRKSRSSGSSGNSENESKTYEEERRREKTRKKGVSGTSPPPLPLPEAAAAADRLEDKQGYVVKGVGGVDMAGDLLDWRVPSGTSAGVVSTAVVVGGLPPAARAKRAREEVTRRFSGQVVAAQMRKRLDFLALSTTET
jgi:hypothetical protein